MMPNAGSFSMPLFTLAIITATWVLCVGAMAAMPYYTRRTIAFGVAVPAARYSDEFFTTLRLQYLWLNLVLGGLLGVLSTAAFAVFSEQTTAIIYSAALVIYLLFSFACFAVFNRKVRAFKRSSDWTIRTETVAVVIDRDDTRKPFNLWLYFIHIAVIAATIAAPYFVWDAIPAQIPMNYNLAGEVASSAAKSPATFAIMPVIQVFMLLIFAGIAWGVSVSKRQTDDADIARGMRNNRTFQMAMQRMLFWLGLLCQVLFLCVQLAMAGVLSVGVTLWLTVLLLVFVAGTMVYIMVRIGQGGHRLSEEEGIDPADVANDDSKWVGFGMFYYDKDDPSVFVERRVGVGWTNNLASPWSWVFIGGIIMMIIALSFLPLWLK